MTSLITAVTAAGSQVSTGISRTSRRDQVAIAPGASRRSPVTPSAIPPLGSADTITVRSALPRILVVQEGGLGLANASRLLGLPDPAGAHHATAVPSSSTIRSGIASRATPSIVVAGATPAAPNRDASTP